MLMMLYRQNANASCLHVCGHRDGVVFPCVSLRLGSIAQVEQGV